MTEWAKLRADFVDADRRWPPLKCVLIHLEPAEFHRHQEIPGPYIITRTAADDATSDYGASCERAPGIPNPYRETEGHVSRVRHDMMHGGEGAYGGGGNVLELPHRVIYFIGGRAELERFDVLATRAGQLALTLPASADNGGLAPATRTEPDAFRRWVWSLFDLAWAGAHPLLTVRTFTPWRGTFVYRDTPGRPTEPYYFAEIAAVFSAAATAIDLLAAAVGHVE